MYRSVEHSFWTDPDVKQLHPDAKLLFLYLITNPHSHISGLYYLPLDYVVKDTGLPMERVRWGIDTLSMGYRAFYDPRNEMVLVARMLYYQGRGAKITSCVQTHVRTLHKSYLIKKLFDLYPEVAFDLGYPIDTPSIPHRDQEQEKEQDQEQERSKPAGAQKPRADAKPTPLSSGRLPGIEKSPSPGCTCPSWTDYDGSCHFPAFKDWAWRYHEKATGGAVQWTEADGKQLWAGYHKFRSRAAAKNSWEGYHLDQSDYTSGHGPKKWASEPGRWPLPVRVLKHPRQAANDAAVEEYLARREAMDVPREGS